MGMRHAAVLTGVVLLSAFLISSVRISSQPNALVGARCRHDAYESAADRTRREAALTLARAINAAEGQAAQRTRRYQPLQQLGSLPPTPDGFILRHYTDGDGYIFSIKDDRDSCQFGVFSDQKGFLYISSPTVPMIAS